MWLLYLGDLLWKEALFWGALQTRNPKTGRDNTSTPELGTKVDLRRSLGLQAELGSAGSCLRNWGLEATVSHESPGFHTQTWGRDKMKRKLRLSRKPDVQMLIPTPFLLAFPTAESRKWKYSVSRPPFRALGCTRDPVLANELKAEDPREGFPSWVKRQRFQGEYTSPGRLPPAWNVGVMARGGAAILWPWDVPKYYVRDQCWVPVCGKPVPGLKA